MYFSCKALRTLTDKVAHMYEPQFRGRDQFGPAHGENSPITPRSGSGRSQAEGGSSFALAKAFQRGMSCNG